MCLYYGVRYVPYHHLGDEPNIVVDGYGSASTVLTLSHWPGSDTPPELRDDLSTQIAFRYLDGGSRAQASAVSNNHFDEDGLCGIYAVLNPDDARRRRAALIDIAGAGDFGTYGERGAARVAFALTAYADEERSPLASELAACGYQDQVALLHAELLTHLPEMIDRPDRYRALWEEDDARLARDEAAISDGTITIEERPELDLAVVAVPEDREPPHEAAVHNATRRMRILTMQGRRYELRYRYETWVVYVSEALAPRIDLAPLAERLTQEEDRGRWEFGGIDDLTPRLALRGAVESALPPEHFLDLVEKHLAR